MQFLSKNPDSTVLSEGLTYQENRANNNKELREKLLQEQRYFCAYTEKYIGALDAEELEHFDDSLKYQDDYYNYYVVIRKANLYKKDEKYQKLKAVNALSAAFFSSRFFQNEVNFHQRIQYLAGEGIYIETNNTDEESAGLIDFLGFNHPELYTERRKHCERLRFIYESLSREEFIDFLRKDPHSQSFITAIEAEFGIKL